MNGFLLRPLDPVVFGTGRPFSSVPGTRLDSAEVPPPSTLAGLVRSEAGRDASGRFDSKRIPELLEKTVRGPFLAVLDDRGGATLALPAPADHVRLTCAGEGSRRHELRRTVPLALEQGQHVSTGELAPVGMPTPTLAKPARNAPGYWSANAVYDWLVQADDLTVPEDHGVWAPAVEWRTHVAIDPSTGTAAEGALFSTGGRRFTGKVDGRQRSLGLYFETDAVLRGGPVVLGGEARLSMLETAGQLLQAEPPPEVLASARGGFVRAYFATPAHFGTGSWWSPPGVAHVVGQVHGRAIAVSGWAFAEPDAQEAQGYPISRNRQRRGGGPKPIRRLVPSGAVYFLQLTSPAGPEPHDPDANEAFVRRLWGRSVHDGQDGADGFGLVLFGTWTGERAPITLTKRDS